VAARGVARPAEAARLRRGTIKSATHSFRSRSPSCCPQRPPSQPLLDAFLVINREQRKQAETTKREVRPQDRGDAALEGRSPSRGTRGLLQLGGDAHLRVRGPRGRHAGPLRLRPSASTKQSPGAGCQRRVVASPARSRLPATWCILDHGLGLRRSTRPLVDRGEGRRPGDEGPRAGRTGATGLGDRRTTCTSSARLRRGR